MWILSLEDKIYWLLGGQKYNIGRKSKNEADVNDFSVTNDASVSRKHLSIEIRSASEDSIFHPSIRSEIVVTDMGSRFGTKVDGSVLESKTPYTVPQTSSGMVNIKLGSSTKARLLWESYVITYSTGQSGDAHKTLWEHAVDILRPLDIKLMPYIVKSTNIFVKTGKSSTSLYYALTQQIPIANTQYFEALLEAANKFSSVGTTENSILPDSSPFLPDPQWVPDPKRKMCLKSLKFTITSEELERALEPILTSAGAEYVKSGSKTAKQQPNDIIFVYASGGSIGGLPENARYTFDNHLYTAIVECRSLKENEIYTQKARKPKSETGGKGTKRSNLLDLMTSQDASPSTGDEGPEARAPPRKKLNNLSLQTSDLKTTNVRGSRDRLLDTITGITRNTSTQTDAEGSSKPEKASSEKESASSVNREARIKGPAQHEAKPGKSSSSVKRVSENVPKPPLAKRKLISRPNGDNDNDDNFIADDTHDSEGEDDGQISDLDTIGELALVENSMPTKNPKQTPMTSNAVSGKKDYKAFRRRGVQINLRSQKIPFDDGGAVNSTDDTKDPDAFWIEPRESIILSDIAKSQPSKTLEDRTTAEESLFVHSDEGSLEDEAVKHKFQRDTTYNIGNAKDEEFGFSFG